MSLETWKAEFYPVDAAVVPKEAALDHSIRKWEGLEPGALRKHGVEASIAGNVLDGLEGLKINSTTCALCMHYVTSANCIGCPLTEVMGREEMRCDESHSRNVLSPYASWKQDGDSRPMLALLRAAKEQGK